MSAGPDLNDGAKVLIPQEFRARDPAVPTPIGVPGQGDGRRVRLSAESSTPTRVRLHFRKGRCLSRVPSVCRRFSDCTLRIMMERSSAPQSSARFDARTIERPDPKLWTYYIITGLMTLVAAPLVLTVLYFRYHTLRYRFDDEGVSISVGFLFKREVYLTYRRIQDIHVTRGLIQRWLGLATISLQTAAGSAAAEAQIEGVLEADALRDWLYARMRGASVEAVEASVDSGADAIHASAAPHASAASADETTAVLEEILHEVRALRERLEQRS